MISEKYQKREKTDENEAIAKNYSPISSPGDNCHQFSAPNKKIKEVKNMFQKIGIKK